MNVDESINEVFTPVSDAIQSVIFYSVNVGDAELPLIVVWLIVAAVLFTIYFGLIQFSGFGHALRSWPGGTTSRSTSARSPTSRRSRRRCREPSDSATSQGWPLPSASAAQERRSG
jgi:AGCS family alanine or glycine:cation symporter